MKFSIYFNSQSVILIHIHMPFSLILIILVISFLMLWEMKTYNLKIVFSEVEIMFWFLQSM